MSEIITVGLDLVKNVFQVHGTDASGRAVLRKKLRRTQVLEFFSRLALSRWKRAAVRILGAARSGNSAMTFC